MSATNESNLYTGREITVNAVIDPWSNHLADVVALGLSSGALNLGHLTMQTH